MVLQGMAFDPPALRHSLGVPHTMAGDPPLPGGRACTARAQENLAIWMSNRPGGRRRSEAGWHRKVWGSASRSSAYVTSGAVGLVGQDAGSSPRR